MALINTIDDPIGGNGITGKVIRYDKAQELTEEEAQQARSNLKMGASAADAVSYATAQELTETQKGTARENIGAATKKGEEPELMAGDLVSLDDPVTVEDDFIIRTTAGIESIDSSKDALLLMAKGGCGALSSTAFKINALRWNGANALDPTAWASGKTSGYIAGAVANGAIISGSNKIVIIHTPKCEVGEYGTAVKNNGWLLTDNENNNLHAGEGSIVGVWYSPTLPAVGSAVTAVTEHRFTGHDEYFYIPDEGYLLLEIASSANLNNISCHLAWSKNYNKFQTYASPVELVLAVSALTSKFDTVTVNGKTCLVLRKTGSGKNTVHDIVVINETGGGYYERNNAQFSLAGGTWTETVLKDDDDNVTGYKYTAPLPTTGTYAALYDGNIRSDVDGINLEGTTLVYESATQITPATEFANKYLDYQIATPVTGTHSIDPTGKKPDDMGTEEVVGGDDATGTIVISYCRGFRDTVRALIAESREAFEKIEEMEKAEQPYCIGQWLENAHTASVSDLENADAIAVMGKKDWALDWRPGLVDMTAVEGETKKTPVELKKNNWLRDIYGNFSPAVGITQAMYDECMANALYTDAECTEQYCAAGAYDPEAFYALCSVATVDGVKVLQHPTLYKDTDTEVTHYLMPWETKETKYSIFVGRKDRVSLLDNVVGASGKEWNGIISCNMTHWDGVDVSAFELAPTGISPSPVTAISINSANYIRSFFYNYASSITGVKGRTGIGGHCTMFYNDGHYPTSGWDQVTTKTNARRNNHTTTAPTPVAEGGYHARNTFLRSVETALGTKNLCAANRFSSGVSSLDNCGNEAEWLANGGVRIKAVGDENWTYKKWNGTGKIYYKDGSNYKTTNMSEMLTNHGPHCKTLEAQIALSYAVEIGVAAGEKFEFNGHVWWYQNPTSTGFAPYTVADGYMNARVYKVVTGSFDAYSDTEGTAETFTVECVLRTALILGCDVTGDIGPYWGGGCEMVGDCTVAPTTNRFGHTIRVFVEPDQTKWVNDDTLTVNMGEKFGFESKYRLLGKIVTRASGYSRRRISNTPLPASIGSSYYKGDCGYNYLDNYWGTVGKRTRVGVRFGYTSANTALSARSLDAHLSAGYTYQSFCGSAQVLWDMQ